MKMGPETNFIFIWNKNCVSLINKVKNKLLITSEDEYKKILNNELTKNSKFIVLAELTWNEYPYCHLYGLEIVCELRRKGIKAPIAIASCLEEEQIEKFTQLLKFPENHPFIKLPFDFTDEGLQKVFSNTKICWNARLSDILTSACKPKGIIIELLTHGEGFSAIYKNKPNVDWKKAEGDFERLKNIINWYPTLKELLKNELNEMENYFKCRDRKKIREIINEIIGKLSVK